MRGGYGWYCMARDEGKEKNVEGYMNLEVESSRAVWPNEWEAEVKNQKNKRIRRRISVLAMWHKTESFVLSFFSTTCIQTFRAFPMLYWTALFQMPSGWAGSTDYAGRLSWFWFVSFQDPDKAVRTYHFLFFCSFSFVFVSAQGRDFDERDGWASIR